MRRPLITPQWYALSSPQDTSLCGVGCSDGVRRAVEAGVKAVGDVYVKVADVCVFLLTGRGALNWILGVSMGKESVPQEMIVALRLTGKATNMLSLTAVVMTLLKAKVALCWNLFLALRPSVLVMSRSPPVLVEMVETLRPAKRAGDTSVLGSR